MKKSIKSGFIHISQIVYLTVRAFFQNNLGICASACTLGFIFSFIPLLMLGLAIFIGVLHTFPNILEEFSSVLKNIAPFFDVNSYISGLESGFVLNWVNVFLALFVIWMARKMFSCVIQSLSLIFKTVSPRRPVLNEIFTFAGEVLLVIVTGFTFFASFVTRQVFKFTIFESFASTFPFLFSHLSNFLVNLVLYVIIFLMTFFAYKFCSGTKPKTRLCLISALACTLFFYVAITIISFFMNRANYDTIYGVLSSLIILLFEVYIFFNLFLLFAQMIFSVQFFYSSLLAELYLLPPSNVKTFADILRRAIFITPSAAMAEKNTITVPAGKKIYSLGESVEAVYYLICGSVKEIRNNSEKNLSEGKFFGDLDFMIDTTHHTEAVALTECKIVKISIEDFDSLLDKNPKAALKAMTRLIRFASKYADKIYGRNETILL